MASICSRFRYFNVNYFAVRFQNTLSFYHVPLRRLHATEDDAKTRKQPETDGEDTLKSKSRRLYPNHIPTSLFQKALLTLGSATLAICDPFRDDMVAVLGETTGCFAARKIQQIMAADPEGKDILREQPRINSETVNLEYLRSLQENSFGQAYIKFLDTNGVSPDTRQPVHFVDDVELAYVIQRYREVHDLVHTLLGMPTNMLGEVAVKWVEAIQTGLPMCAAGALFGPIRFKSKQRQKYLKKYLPWALNCGFHAKFLMNVYYERRWEQDITSLRNELNIPPPPEGT